MQSPIAVGKLKRIGGVRARGVPAKGASQRPQINEEGEGGSGNSIDNNHHNRRQKAEHYHQNGHQDGTHCLMWPYISALPFAASAVIGTTVCSSER